MATIEDVARRAGVSIATVSRVLSPGATPHPVSPVTARKVREAAAALDFVPSALASGLASRRSSLVGLLVPDLADPHYPQVARGAEDVARQEGLALLVCNTLGDSARFADYLRVLRARRVDALVVSGGSSLRAGDLLALRRTGLTCVLIGRPSVPCDLPYVAVDNRGAARAAVEHLLGSGRRRVAHLAGPLTQTTMADRAAGYRDALEAAAMSPCIAETDGTAEAGARAAVRLWGSQTKARPDAIFAATDRLAIAALGALRERGVRVPSDLALVGFDDLPLAAYLAPALATVAQPAQQLGIAAIQLVLESLAGRPVQSQVLHARLVVRASAP